MEVRYNTFGQLNAARDNVLVVCHALTGNARLDTWWASMLGPGRVFDTDKYVRASIDRSRASTGKLTTTEPLTHLLTTT